MLANPRQTADDLAEWIRRYFEENGPKCSAVVGLSGGKDSTVTAALCVKALGAGRVVGVLMPDGVQADIEDAREIARVLGIRTVEVNIHAAVEGLRGALEASPGLLELSGTDGLTRDAAINMPARIRMTTLYAVGQMLPQGGRVANTCNLSEDWVGYCTIYGDSAGAFSPLGMYTTEEVIALGAELGLPERFLIKPPSDGLTGKTDEDNLGFTYHAVNEYVRRGVVDPAIKEQIDRKHKISRFKFQTLPVYQNGLPIVLPEETDYYNPNKK